MISETAGDIDTKKIVLEKSAIYILAGSLDRYKKKFGSQGRLHSFVSGADHTLFVVNETDNRTIYTFSEKYILENLT